MIIPRHRRVGFNGSPLVPLHRWKTTRSALFVRRRSLMRPKLSIRGSRSKRNVFISSLRRRTNVDRDRRVDAKTSSPDHPNFGHKRFCPIGRSTAIFIWQSILRSINYGGMGFHRVSSAISTIGLLLHSFLLLRCSRTSVENSDCEWTEHYWGPVPRIRIHRTRETPWIQTGRKETYRWLIAFLFILVVDIEFQFQRD